MSSTQFNKDSSYRLSAEVKNRLLRPGKEAELCSWIQGLTGLSLCPDFQKGLKDGTVLRTLINKLQQSSVPKINRSMQNWHQLENLSNFIKEGMNTVDLFEASDLFESGNMRQVQVSLLALVGKAKTKRLQSGVDIGLKYWEKQKQNFDDATMKAGQCAIGLQMGTNKCTSQSGMTADGTRRHLYNPKNHLLPPMDHSTISLQMGTNKCASQVGFWTPGTLPRHPVDTKLGTDKCDNSSMSLQMGYTQSAKQSGQVFGLGTVANGAPSGASDCPGLMEVPEYPPYFQEEAGY
uniref:Calponin n=1 Tax=Mandrillus leucophaeus TaxID=9568 RepID=A0A2K5YII4_MANLE